MIPFSPEFDLLLCFFFWVDIVSLANWKKGDLIPLIQMRVCDMVSGFCGFSF